MSNGAWTDQENDLIVADYFAMLADDISALRYSKAEHRRALLPLLNDRSEVSVEFMHQNTSAVLKGLAEDWIPGYIRSADRNQYASHRSIHGGCIEEATIIAG